MAGEAAGRRGEAVPVWLGRWPRPGRYGAVDVHYPSSGGARAALVIAKDIALADVGTERTVELVDVAPYRAGQFFVRELPALRAVLADVDGL
ncbi:MAG: hypothetical protein ACLGIA_02860, partial [Actinomycetes bacterium]